MEDVGVLPGSKGDLETSDVGKPCTRNVGSKKLAVTFDAGEPDITPSLSAMSSLYFPRCMCRHITTMRAFLKIKGMPTVALPFRMILNSLLLLPQVFDPS